MSNIKYHEYHRAENSQVGSFYLQKIDDLVKVFSDNERFRLVTPLLCILIYRYRFFFSVCVLKTFFIKFCDHYVPIYRCLFS